MFLERSFCTFFYMKIQNQQNHKCSPNVSFLLIFFNYTTPPPPGGGSKTKMHELTLHLKYVCPGPIISAYTMLDLWPHTGGGGGCVRARQPVGCTPGDPAKPYLLIYCPATSTQFSGPRGWVCRIFVKVSVKNVAQVGTFPSPFRFVTKLTLLKSLTWARLPLVLYTYWLMLLYFQVINKPHLPQNNLFIFE